MIIQNFQADERRLRCVNTSQQPIGASQQLESGANSATSAKHSKSPATINGHATKICVFEKKGSIIREHLTRPKYGLISADSHANLHKDAFIARMAKGKWGDRIPQVKEVAENGRLVERWVVDGKIVGGRGVVNCAAVMDDPLRRTFPQRWEDVPAKVYDPLERLKALDSDRVDAEVLFF